MRDRRRARPHACARARRTTRAARRARGRSARARGLQRRWRRPRRPRSRSARRCRCTAGRSLRWPAPFQVAGLVEDQDPARAQVACDEGSHRVLVPHRSGQQVLKPVRAPAHHHVERRILRIRPRRDCEHLARTHTQTRSGTERSGALPLHGPRAAMLSYFLHPRNARPYRRSTISSSIRAVIEVRCEPEPPSTWAVTVTTASLSGEIMQSWP